MATPKVYVICDDNCKLESMTREQILTAIAQAVETGSVGNCDTGFIQTIKTVNGKPLRFFVGTQAEYNDLADKSDLFAIITDETFKNNILNVINKLHTKHDSLNNNVDHLRRDLASGDFPVEIANRVLFPEGYFEIVSEDGVDIQVPIGGMLFVSFPNSTKTKRYTSLLHNYDIETTKYAVIEGVGACIEYTGEPVSDNMAKYKLKIIHHYINGGEAITNYLTAGEVAYRILF